MIPVEPYEDQPFTLTDEQTDGWGRAMFKAVMESRNQDWGGTKLGQKNSRQKNREGAGRRARCEERSPCQSVFWDVVLGPFHSFLCSIWASAAVQQGLPRAIHLLEPARG